MDLRKPDNLSPELQQAYDFLRDSQLSSMAMDPLFLCSLLDEYIFVMNEKYNMFNERVINKELNNMTIINHVINFERLVQGEEITDDEKNLIINFYEELLNYIDGIINDKYCLGRKLNEQEKEIIAKTSHYRKLTNICSMNNVIAYVPKGIFDKKLFDEYSLDYVHTKLSGSVCETENYDVIEFNNINNNFYFCHLCGIKYCCNEMVSFAVDYSLSSDDKLVIVFDIIF